jgi:hypothetical protein
MYGVGLCLIVGLPSLRRCFTRLRMKRVKPATNWWSRQLGLVPVEFDPLIKENFLRWNSINLFQTGRWVLEHRTVLIGLA